MSGSWASAADAVAEDASTEEEPGRTNVSSSCEGSGGGRPAPGSGSGCHGWPAAPTAAPAAAAPPPASSMEARLMGGPPWGRVGTVPSVPNVAVASGGPWGRVGTLPTPGVPMTSASQPGWLGAAATAAAPPAATAAAARVWLPAGRRGAAAPPAAAPAATAAGAAGMPPQPWLPPEPGLPKLLGPLADERGVMLAGSCLSAGGAASRARRLLRYTVKPIASAAAQGWWRVREHTMSLQPTSLGSMQATGLSELS